MTEKELSQQKESRIIKLEKEIERWKKAVKTQRYGLVWLDVPEAFEDDVENKLPILEEVPKKAIRSKDAKPTHLLIEGDNYHALTCLNYTHKGKIDVIYIDPPYNTGSDGFRYKDKRILKEYPDGTEVPKDHPFRHSYWLSFMSKRLELAKSLLKDTGTIFISINEDEFAQLKLLCDQTFGLENYLTMFTIKVRHEERILKGDKDFHEVVEYLLMYRCSSAYKTTKKIYDNTSLDEYIYQVIEKIEHPKSVKLGNKMVDYFEPSEYEIIKVPASEHNLKKINIRGSLKEGNSSGRFYMAHIASRGTKGVLYKVPDMGNDKFGHRYFLIPAKESRLNGDYFQGVPLDIQDTKKVPYPNYFDFEAQFNSVGYEGGVSFGGGKKPVEFLAHFINIGCTDKNATILDFFAGSGSTGHAVMQMNEADKGKRQFILITNDNEIVKDKVYHPMSEACLPRMQNLIKGYDKNPSLGNSIKYYKTAFVGKHNILDADDKDKIQLAHNAGGMLAIAENTLEQIKGNDYWQIFESETRMTAVYFREEQDQLDDFIDEVLLLGKPVTVYMFSWEEKVDIVDFEENRNISLKTIPQPILEIYKQIYNIAQL
ncbi:MAG: Adenine specific DNA methylase Mod [Candidatus Wolfebacteria bacterium GW2011_GWC2_46_275]|uniref:Adenine specific DNA methylase Mod n=2 Tax=Candidatus Wolfeibacteriota TaxID=1752735 RepID=A0A0G1X855_9BACT|nr:MAG: recognition and methylase subunit mod (type iii restriction and modification system),llafi-like protein [Candidatus Wolfebacteria bacterium GW2011_GWB1_47_1]KKU36179.1 MAG: Adenine specific DNA methylase Mod [Candidatus Wolfebacteria bacterium GW2011_GWC2_46_275]KKU42103.1 MAG: Adenine specific DNA methylase Mod [Candidatus Wolfebacteria bacterium GW2011_GWB2_46_69]KKU53731.1 MAG: Adenine specific DNA methylase Mod [Candidatus Wolfebacteria bacterium GW2011_GWC1_47_103]KKU59308.1 MAG: A